MKQPIQDDSGAALLIEYVFTIIIAAILFSMLLLTTQSIVTKSNQIIMSEEMDIVSSIVANQLADYSSELSINTYLDPNIIYAPTMSVPANCARYFNVPQPDSGKQYFITVSDGAGDTGIVTATYLSDPDISSTFTFYTPYTVESSVIYCSTYRLKITNPAAHTIRLEEEGVTV